MSDDKLTRAIKRATIAQCKVTIATAQVEIAQLRAHGAHPKNSIEGAQRDVRIAEGELVIAQQRHLIVQARAD